MEIHVSGEMGNKNITSVSQQRQSRLHPLNLRVRLRAKEQLLRQTLRRLWVHALPRPLQSEEVRLGLPRVRVRVGQEAKKS